MRIEVRLCESLARGHRQGRAFSVALKSGATVGDALTRLKLSQAGFRLALCNGANLLTEDGVIDAGRQLADGDHLVLGAAADWAGAIPLRSFVERLSSLLSPLAQTP